MGNLFGLDLDDGNAEGAKEISQTLCTNINIIKKRRGGLFVMN